MRISDWSSDVCSSDLLLQIVGRLTADETFLGWVRGRARRHALTLSLQDLLEERGRAEAALDLVTATRRYWEDDASVRVDDLARQQIDREGIWLSGRSEDRRVGQGGVSKGRTRW